ncbi:MAG TPA: RDD family protein [Burkholderiales bacterium]
MESSWSGSPERVEPRFGDGSAPPPRERADPTPRDRADARFDYAGFWQRAVALLVDWLIVVVIAMPIIVVSFGADYFSLDPVRRSGDLVIAALVGALIVGFWRYCGATPGKLAAGIKIVDAATGAAPATMRLVIRLLCYFVSALPLCLGFLWAAFDRRKQGWHDKIAGTVVIQETD